MPSSHAFAVFIPAALVLLAIPGPAVLYIVATSVDGGRRNGLVSVAGIHLGSLVHIAAAVAGLSALIVSSAIAFSAVKYVGAAYLVYVGIRKLLGKDEPLEDVEQAPRSARRIFGQGVVVNVLNPKTALFFLAFMPQFVDPDRPVWTQTIVLGLCWIALGLLSDGAYALAGGTIGGVLRRRRKAVRYASGGSSSAWAQSLQRVELGRARVRLPERLGPHVRIAHARQAAPGSSSRQHLFPGLAFSGIGFMGIDFAAGISFAGGVSIFDMCDIPGIEPVPGIVSPGSAPGVARSSTPSTARTPVVPYSATRRHGTSFSSAIRPATTAIHTRLITPSAKSEAISAQQHPTHQAPWRVPIRSAPPARRARSRAGSRAGSGTCRGRRP